MRYLFILLLLTACTMEPETQSAPIIPDDAKTAVFAGGCFWCMEAPFEQHEGVFEVVSGYTGGDEENPTYKQVSSGTTGHVEAVEIIYDPSKISYKELLDIFWQQVDPTDDKGQFVDRGHQYTSGIFYETEEEKEIATQSKKELDDSGRYDKPVITPIEQLKKFYVAEDYHQNYYKTSPIRYKYYRSGSGRDKFLDKVWD